MIRLMTYILEVPVESGGRLLVQAGEDDLPDGLELAALHPGELVARARDSVEAAMDEVKPAISAVANRLKEMSADEVVVEFGIVLGAETGVVIAKGTADVHFTVKLTWEKESGRGAIERSIPDASKLDD
jgi:hypothetical protein